MLNIFKKTAFLMKSLHDLTCPSIFKVYNCWMMNFSSTGQLVTFGLVDSSIGTMAETMAKRLAFNDG